MAQFYLCGIDIGSSTVKLGFYHLETDRYFVISSDYKSYYNNDGCIEQNPEEIWEAICDCFRQAFNSYEIEPKKVSAISLSSQRGTLFLMDRQFKPLMPAISWQDNRGINQQEKIKTLIPWFSQNTGLQISSTWSIASILWLKENQPQLFDRTSYFLLCQSYLLYRLGVVEPIDDAGSASYSGLMNIHQLDWDKDLLNFVEISPEQLPKLKKVGERIGAVSREASLQTGLKEGTPLILGAGDQQAAAIGAGLMEEKSLGLNLGTAGVMFSYVKDRENLSTILKQRLILCAHAKEKSWQIEGLQSSGASLLNWFKKVSSFKDYTSIDLAANKVSPGAHGCMFLPFFAGSATPRWDSNMKGLFWGLNFCHTQEHMARAIMEGVSFELRECFDSFCRVNLDIKEIILTGGAANSKTWCKIMPSLFNHTFTLRAIEHASNLGAIIIAGYGIGCFKSLAEGVEAYVKTATYFHPDPKETERYLEIYDNYKELVDSVEKFVEKKVNNI